MKNRTETIVLADKLIKASYVFTKRKSLVIKVVSPDEIEVRAPFFLSAKKIEKFLYEKEDWIVLKSNQIKVKDDRTIFYLGNKYEICLKEGNDIVLDGDIMYIPNHFNEEQINKWYKKKSVEIVTQLYNNIDFIKEPVSIKVKKQKKRWGSCTSKGNIYINSNISKCRVDVIEYILYHELCHLVHMNHSKDFYMLLKEYCGDYKEKKKWLKENYHNVN